MADDPKNEACKTYLEQTKLLVTLASAFIVAPAFYFEKIYIFSSLVMWTEICFVASVFIGYVVFGTISGTQYKGEFNVYNKGTTIFSWLQIALFVIGIILLIIAFNTLSNRTPPTKQSAVDSTIRPPYHQDEVVRLNNIFFDFAKWDLRPESFVELSRLTDTLKKYPRLEIRIQAHTDSVGSDQFNLKLSQKRAYTVADYLIRQGIQSSRLSSIGYGKTMPLTTNTTYEGRQINRRVEFKVMRLN